MERRAGRGSWGVVRIARVLSLLVLSPVVPAPWAPQAEAQAGARALPTVLVVQSGLGLGDGEALRAELSRRLPLSVVSIRDGQLSKSPPQALLAVAVDEGGTLNALYWDGNGSFDALSMPAPAAATERKTAAITLGLALLQRHVASLQGGGPPTPAYSDLERSADRIIRAALHRALDNRPPLGRLAIRMYAEEF